ncbi:MAG: DedA family protein [Thaumarchaeota archaeon]|nr:DedA family protein [Nitrososphaerota archaeon]
MGPTFSKRTYSSYGPWSRYLAAVAVAAFCLSILEIVDAFEFPFEANLAREVASGSLFSTDLLASFLNIGYAGLFALMLLESASAPIPSEVVLPFAGYLAFLGRLNLGLAILVSTAAGLIGALIDYYLALKLGRPIVYRLMRRLGISETHLDQGERWVDSRGAWSVFVARFIPGLRSIVSVPAGLLRMKMRPFVILTTIGSFVWSAVLIYAGYSAGPLWQNSMGSFFGLLGQAVPFIVAGASILYVLYYYVGSRNRGAAAPR